MDLPVWVIMNKNGIDIKWENPISLIVIVTLCADTDFKLLFLKGVICNQ